MQELVDAIASIRGVSMRELAFGLSAGVSSLASVLLLRMDRELPTSSPRRRDARSFDEAVAELRHLQVALAPVLATSQRRRAG